MSMAIKTNMKDSNINCLVILPEADPSVFLIPTSLARFADLAVARIEPIASEMRRLQSDPAEIDAILADGSARAREIASGVLADVREITGFIGARR